MLYKLKSLAIFILISSSLPAATGELGWRTTGTNILETEFFDIAQIPMNRAVRVAVIDENFNFSHEQMSGINFTNSNEIANNGIDDDNNGLIDDVNGWDFNDNDNDPETGEYHGTQVISIIAGTRNEQWNVGGLAADNIEIVPIRIKFSTQLYEALYYAVSMNVDIIQVSLGYGVPSGEYFTALAAVENAGIVVIASAGNQGGENEDVYPGASDYVFGVANHRTDYTRYFSSNYGNQVEFASYGSNIWIPNEGSYSTESGTSYSAPVITGLLSRLIGYGNQTWTKENIEAYLASHSVALADGTTLKHGRLDTDSILTDYLTKEVRYVEIENGSNAPGLLEFWIYSEISSGETLSAYLAYYYAEGIRYSVFQEVEI